MNFVELLNHPAGLPYRLSADRTDAVNRFLDPASGAVRFVVGRNAQSEALLGEVPLTGLIDDRAEPGTLWHGLPVVGMQAVPREASVLSTSTSIAPVSTARALEGAGFAGHLNLGDLLASPLCPASLIPDFINDQRRDVADHAEGWREIYDRLEDDLSKQTLTDVLRFRLTADINVMQGYSVRLEDQYFEDFLGLRQEVFVDAGGFDGDTTEQFCRRVPDYRRVFFFEPAARNMAAAMNRLARFPRIDFIPIGLSDTPGELFFDGSSGSASSVSESGGEAIRVDLLDNLVADPVTFVKMDLEGWELHALRGAANLITRDRPKLAIAVYHKASHFRQVFGFVLKLFPNYRVRLRHYTEGWSETVMFFVP